MSGGLLDWLGYACLFGVAGRLLVADAVERRVLLAAIQRAIEIDERRAKNQAVHIANAVGQLFRR